MTDELWQGYNEQGEPTDGVTLAQARIGALHGTAHVWVWHRSADGIKVLLQQRASDTSTWPGYLDVSAAGHIDYGETPLQTAARETSEEIGIAVRPEQLHLLFVHHQSIALLDSKVIEKEFQWVYGLELNHGEHFRLIDGEVDSVRWLPLSELQELVGKDLKTSNLVPHGPVYFAELFRAIELIH